MFAGRIDNLAEMFHRLRLIESYGTGIRRIYQRYETCPAQPVIQATPNAFKIVLPNMNKASAAAPKTASPVTAQMQQILDFIAEQGQITDEEVQTQLGIKKTRAFNLMKQMRELELVQMTGRGANKRYLRRKDRLCGVAL